MRNDEEGNSPTIPHSAIGIPPLQWLRRRRIAVLLGGRSGERPISLKTGEAIWKSLKRQGFDAVKIDPAGDLSRDLRRHRVNFAYIALHGPGGEDGAIQGFLEQMRIPYTGSGILASALAMDKVACKRFFDAEGLQTAKWFTVERGHDDAGRRRERDSTTMARRLGFPLVVKPSDQGSALGVTIVRSSAQWAGALRSAFRYGQTALVESYLQGPEITVGVLGTQALPIIEIVPQSRSFYDFHAKYAPGGSRHILPARIRPSAARRATALALQACRLIGTRGAARVDFIVDRRRGPTLLEVNTIPGMTETSLLPEAARAAGIDFDALVVRIALESRHGAKE
ncbi:MAG TPA: D-alanine--D-alanine ligase [Elusimicrobiota bacterium]|nr:D-alanine--D-alanine ligase [Elusimicrobiota bacterium]